MKLLEMSHVKKKFGDLEVLKDISVTVEEGQVLAIIGPSGTIVPFFNPLNAVASSL